MNQQILNIENEPLLESLTESQKFIHSTEKSKKKLK